MIEYSFWTHDKVDGVEALVYVQQMNQTTFSSVAILEQIVNEPPENAKSTSKAVVLPDPVLEDRLVYNGTNKKGGRKYLTEVTFVDGTQAVDQHRVVGVQSIAYPTHRKVDSIKVWEVKSPTDKKQVFELSL